MDARTPFPGGESDADVRTGVLLARSGMTKGVHCKERLVLAEVGRSRAEEKHGSWRGVWRNGTAGLPRQTWISADTHVYIQGKPITLSVVFDITTLRMLGWAIGEGTADGLAMVAIRASLGSRTEFPDRIFCMSSQLTVAERGALQQEFGVDGIFCNDRALRVFADSLLLRLNIECLWRTSYADVGEARFHIAGYVGRTLGNVEPRHPVPYRKVVAAIGLPTGE